MSDYFSLFGLPHRYAVDEKALQQAYFVRQRESHPDTQSATDPALRQKALLASAEINKAYQTLKSPLLRAEYMLSLQGYAIGSEEGAVKPSVSLLAESLEQREALMEADSAEAVAALERMADVDRETTLSALKKMLDGGEWEPAAGLAMRLRYLEKFAEEIRGRAKLLQARAS